MALKRKDAPAKGAKRKSTRGTGSGTYKVKGKRATSRQRENIDGILSQCEDDNASRRVMIAAIMAATEESRMGEEQGVTGNDDLGIFQQGRNWISASGAKNAKKATHAFLITGPTSWRKVHGGVKKAPGNLSAAIHAVQGNKDPNAYARWEKEATATVTTWLADGGSEAGTYAKRYTFTRGEKGGDREDSWDASDRLVKEVGGWRWAVGNVFYCVSGDELRRAAPAMTIRGDEPWLRKDLAWSWASRRSITEINLEVFADRWDVMPGAMVEMHRDLGAMSGRWMVFNVSGPSLESPEATVVLQRPTRLKSEPAHETAQTADEGGDGPKTVEKLKSVCKDISANRASYKYGGGHGPPVKDLKGTDHLDCSSSVSLALAAAGFFPKSKPAYTSGAFMSWGKAGKGDEFTIWANGSHVWIEFDNGDRFDTSQHEKPSGPAYTTKKRTDQGRFTPRHYEGH